MHRGGAALLALLPLVACANSNVAPDAPIAIEGQVLDVDGSPLDDRPVRLGVGLGPDEVGAALLTLGLTCVSGECDEDVFTATTDGDGRYRLDLTGRDTQTALGRAETNVLEVSAAPRGDQLSGASASASFEVQHTQVRMPPLALVDSALEVRPAGRAVEVRWDGASGLGEVTFETEAPVPVWRLPGSGGRAVVDARVLEDAVGRVVVSGTHADAVEGSDVAIRRRSPGVPFVGGLGAPPSRGAPCGQPATCSFTDGDLSTGSSAAGPVTVQLAKAVPAELVVVRGCVSTCQVEVSTDGTTFAVAGAVTGDHGTVGLDGADVLLARVTPGPSHLREISVWGPAPERDVLDDVDDAGGLFGGLGDAGDGERAPGWLVVCAVAAIVFAAGVLVGRRRRIA